MSSRKPPKLALWMLKHFGCSPDSEVLAGDLLERYFQDQSRFWFWRQILTSIAGGFLEEALTNKGLMLRAIVMGWAGVLIFRGGVLEIASNIAYIQYVKYLDPAAFRTVIDNGRVVATFLPGPLALKNSGAFVICTLICMGITGLIAARVGGAHRKAALFSYAGSLLIVMMISAGPVLVLQFLDRTGSLPWRGLGIILLNIAAVLVAGLWNRSPRVNPPQPQAAS